jgi:hypothetical protein
MNLAIISIISVRFIPATVKPISNFITKYGLLKKTAKKRDFARLYERPFPTYDKPGL